MKNHFDFLVVSLRKENDYVVRVTSYSYNERTSNILLTWPAELLINIINLFNSSNLYPIQSLLKPDQETEDLISTQMAIKLMKPETELRRGNRLRIIINPKKLEGGIVNEKSQSSGMTIRVETRVGFQNKKSLLSPRREIRRASSERVLGGNSGKVEWGENDGVLVSSCSDQCELNLSFSVLRKVEGRDQKSEKWEEMGREGMKINDLGKRKEAERRLLIQLRGEGGAVLVSTLTVVMSITAEDEVESDEIKKPKLFKLLSFPNKNKVTVSNPASVELIRSKSLHTQPSWIKKRIESLLSGCNWKVAPVVRKVDSQSQKEQNGKTNTNDMNENMEWQVTEIVSRDGATELKCSVGLASYDQCSEQVAGEGACSVIAAVVAYWLHSNKGRMPNRSEFNRLMVDGATEWRKLCDNINYSEGFSDKHFDIETVVRAGIRPMRINHENSVVGFFSPDKFALLKEAVSVDGIWSDIERKTGVYIVSWNDHFCVLKVENEACYVIDSLGERLTEGSSKAFILKFDESSVMKSKERTSKTERECESIGEVGSATQEDEGVEEKDEMIICRGKECCKEYFKRFLAAILVSQLKVEEDNSITGTSNLHKRLQIEFQYTTTCV